MMTRHSIFKHYNKIILLGMIISVASVANTYATRELSPEEIEQEKQHQKMNAERKARIENLMANTKCPDIYTYHLRDLGQGKTISLSDGIKWQIASAYSGVSKEDLAVADSSKISIHKKNDKPKQIGPDLPIFCEYELEGPQGKSNLTLMYEE